MTTVGGDEPKVTGSSRTQAEEVPAAVPPHEPSSSPLTTEDRQSVQADLADERERLQRLQNVEPLRGLEGVRRAAVAAKERYIARLERMLEDATDA